MSFLAWVFALGGLGVIFPLLFHLIRPSPRGRQAFSSLMFIKPSPPRMIRRRRLDNWLLLVLRTMIVLALAAAFMRPFFRQSANLFSGELSQRRVAILLDTSASMQRSDLWQQATAQIQQVLDELDAGDEVGLFTFDDDFETVVGFSASGRVPTSSNAALIRQQLQGIRPGWGSTNLGRAMIDAADELLVAADLRRTAAASQLVLITDLQQGSRLNALEAFQWPAQIRLDVRPVRPEESTNAFVRLLADDAGDEKVNQPRVRVVNSADSQDEQFFVTWQSADDEDQQPAAETSFYVPPGQSRTLRIPRQGDALTANQLVLRGDSEDFDNRHYLVPVEPSQFHILYLGRDGENDADGLLYFLKRALLDSGRRKIQFRQLGDEQSLAWPVDERPAMVVATQAVTQQQKSAARRYLETGGTLLVVLQDRQTAESWSDVLGMQTVVAADDNDHPGDITAGRVETSYAMLAEIDFSHPLFVPFASARYNDFTKIQFWKHQIVELDQTADVHVIARFDDHSPAIWQHAFGDGMVFALASGWQPDSSQLALSSKFVPLMDGLLNLTVGTRPAGQSSYVGQPIALGGDHQPAQSPQTWTLLRPDGTEVPVSETVPAKHVNQPGIYQLAGPDESHWIAVNLRPGESRTAPMPVEQLESYDVKLGTQPNRREQVAALQKIHDVEMERQQKIWKWLLLGGLGLLVVETLVAGRTATRPIETGMTG